MGDRRAELPRANLATSDPVHEDFDLSDEDLSILFVPLYPLYDAVTFQHGTFFPSQAQEDEWTD